MSIYIIYIQTTNKLFQMLKCLNKKKKNCQKY